MIHKFPEGFRFLVSISVILTISFYKTRGRFLFLPGKQHCGFQTEFSYSRTKEALLSVAFFNRHYKSCRDFCDIIRYYKYKKYKLKKQKLTNFFDIFATGTEESCWPVCAKITDVSFPSQLLISGGPRGRVGKVAEFQIDHLTDVTGVGLSPALATFETSHVLLAGVSGGFPGVLPFRPTYRVARLNMSEIILKGTLN